MRKEEFYADCIREIRRNEYPVILHRMSEEMAQLFKLSINKKDDVKKKIADIRNLLEEIETRLS